MVGQVIYVDYKHYRAYDRALEDTTYGLSHQGQGSIDVHLECSSTEKTFDLTVIVIVVEVELGFCRILLATPTVILVGVVIELVTSIPPRLATRSSIPEKKDKAKAVLLTVLQRRKVVIIRNIQGLYITREREIHDKRGIINAVRQTNSNQGGRRTAGQDCPIRGLTTKGGKCYNK